MPKKKRDPLAEATRIGAALPAAGAPLLPHERDKSFPAAGAPLVPHERDKSLAAPAPPQSEMIQAQRDVARGLEDTNCYTRLGKAMPRPRRK